MNQILKSLIIVSLLSLSSGIYAQIHDDFEGNGNISTWFGDDCGINTSFDNPFIEGTNQSAKVLKYSDQGGLYANVRFDAGFNFDMATSYVFSFMIYVPSSEITGNQNNQVSLKLQDGKLGQPWVTQSEIIKNIALDEWQTLTFDFKNDNYLNLDGSSPAPTQRTDFNRVVIQVNGENNNDHVVAYIDNFYYETEIPEPEEPETPQNFDKLIWSDEFDGNGAIDTEKWFHQTKLPNGGSWYNNEQQHYTNRTENSYVENGTLKIVAKKESFTDQGVTKKYTSARLNSKFAFKYGKVEVRAKLPSGRGTWPAIWTLGKNINEDGAYWDLEGFGTDNWPYCGEIDIMEHWGSNQNYVSSATHTPSSYGGTINHGGQYISTVSSEFHVYTLEWTANKLVFSVDNNIHFTYNPAIKDSNTWPFDAEQYLLLNVAIASDIDPAFSQGAMEIDYVRVYQSEALSLNDNKLQNIKFYPNPVEDVLNISLAEVLDNNTVEFKLYTTQGILLKSDKVQVKGSKITISELESLPQGLYLINLQNENKTHSFTISKN